MTFRTLCGALALLLFVAPLGATICGACAPERCMMREASADCAQNEPKVEDHCPKTEASRAQEAPSCHGRALVMISSECCSVTSASEPEQVAAPTGLVVFEITLEAAIEAATPTAEHDRPEDRRRRPPLQIPRPLYTLHSAFLI